MSYTATMELEQRELDELAVFFAKRFGDPAERDGLVSQAGIQVDADQGWPAILEAASRQGCMSALSAAALHRRPDDENLQALAGTLEEPGISTRVMAVAAVVLLALGAGAAAWYASAHTHLDRLHPADGVLADQIPPEAVRPAPTPVVAAVEVDPVEAVASVEDVETTGPVQAFEPPDPVVHVEAALEGRCAASEGELVGYWYAGFPFEAQQGEIYTVLHGKYVRAGYPARDNAWDHQQPVRCALESGDRVRLSHAPVLVDGGKYWVPLHGGDLLRPAR